ncbi:TIGR03862 family flavoprotein [Herbaspirillum sp. RV1423]|uniref:NAD(P)/FAD-dependent oxidoreductase n=1 Tax=Herbaspirillum sp. RV1423 TaxID=1443993 RepID=UPI0004BA54FA|nr:TIGR03862 family flavoprotein [Herbaspirillum sp. RV1423]
MPHPATDSRRIAIVGGGPAGLMAAEVLALAGVQVDLYDAMPSVGRKFLLAGKGGMNITHSENIDGFLSRYGARRNEIAALLKAFTPDDLRAWIHGLGIDTFVGSSGRVFPADMKAAPLLRAWLHRLREAGVRFHMRHRWQGWDADGRLRFATPEGEVAVPSSALILALGGGSWARLGSDGAWMPLLQERGVALAPLRPSNCGFDVDWSEHFRSRAAGEPLKTVAASVTLSDGSILRRQGECVITDAGIEGGLIYALSAPLRDAITPSAPATLHLDLLPDWTAARLLSELQHPRGARSMSSHLQSRLRLKGVKAALLRECTGTEDFHDMHKLAQAIKHLPVSLRAARPIDEAISSAGGVLFEAMQNDLMLRRLPGVFCAGEMLDWEAPTGGYLLTACFASGRTAAQGALRWLGERPAGKENTP